MSNALVGHVWVVDTTGQLSTNVELIESIKLVAGGADATLTVKKGTSTGTVMFQIQAAQNTEVYDHDVCLRFPAGCYVTISGTGAKAYLVRE